MSISIHLYVYVQLFFNCQTIICRVRENISTPSTRARKHTSMQECEHAKHVKYASTQSTGATQARDLADSFTH